MYGFDNASGWLSLYRFLASRSLDGYSWQLYCGPPADPNRIPPSPPPNLLFGDPAVPACHLRAAVSRQKYAHVKVRMFVGYSQQQAAGKLSVSHLESTRYPRLSIVLWPIQPCGGPSEERVSSLCWCVWEMVKRVVVLGRKVNTQRGS